MSQQFPERYTQQSRHPTIAVCDTAYELVIERAGLESSKPAMKS